MDTKSARAICDAATCAPGYEVTRDGRVFSTESNWRGYGVREIHQTMNSHGYPRVRLSVNGKRTSKLVHQLVALAFLPPRPSPSHQVRHLNGNKMDARAENLAWGTAKENAADRDAHGNTARGERNGFSKLTNDAVATIRSLWHQGMTQRGIAAVVNVHQKTVFEVLHGKRWRAA